MKTNQERLPQVVDAVRRYAELRAKHETRQAWRMLETLESPIEQMFVMALAMTNCLMFPDDWMRPNIAAWMWDDGDAGVFFADLDAQVLIGRFRVDFVLNVFHVKGVQTVNYDNPIKFIIECDGKEFHDKHEGQVKRDRERDRTLTAKGYRVLRFTGQEITVSSAKVVKELIDCVFSVARTYGEATVVEV